MTPPARLLVRPLTVWRWWPGLVALLLGGLLLATQANDLRPVLDRLTYPYQLDDSEGVILGETQLLLNGVDIYQPVEPDFFTAAPYPPLYYHLLAPLVATGDEPFPAARAVTLVATFLLALLIAGLVARQTGQLAAGLVAAGLWLAPNLVAVWSVRARPDLLALTANLGALALIMLSARLAGPSQAPPDRRWLGPALIGAALLCAVGFYFKHTALAAPAAIGLWLLLRRPRAAIGFGLVYLAAVLAPYGLLNLTTSGGFNQHLVSFHRSWLWSNYVELALPFVTRYWPLIVLPAGGLVLDLVWHRRLTLPSLYLLTASVVSLGGGTHGGNHNHLLETLLALALASGAALGRALSSRLAAPALLVAGLAAGALIVEPTAGRSWLAGDLRAPSANERLGWQQVVAVVATEPGPIYSDNVGLLVLTGHPIAYTDPFTMAGSVQAGLWSDAALVAAIRQRRYPLLALRYDVTRLRGVPTDITPDLLAAIREHYVVADRNVMFLYRPR